jgi:hypothetical protein
MHNSIQSGPVCKPEAASISNRRRPRCFSPIGLNSSPQTADNSNGETRDRHCPLLRRMVTMPENSEGVGRGGDLLSRTKRGPEGTFSCMGMMSARRRKNQETCLSRVSPTCMGSTPHHVSGFSGAGAHSCCSCLERHHLLVFMRHRFSRSPALAGREARRTVRCSSAWINSAGPSGRGRWPAAVSDEPQLQPRAKLRLVKLGSTFRRNLPIAPRGECV